MSSNVRVRVEMANVYFLVVLGYQYNRNFWKRNPIQVTTGLARYAVGTVAAVVVAPIIYGHALLAAASDSLHDRADDRRAVAQQAQVQQEPVTNIQLLQVLQRVTEVNAQNPLPVLAPGQVMVSIRNGRITKARVGRTFSPLVVNSADLSVAPLMTAGSSTRFSTRSSPAQVQENDYEVLPLRLTQLSAQDEEEGSDHLVFAVPMRLSNEDGSLTPLSTTALPMPAALSVIQEEDEEASSNAKSSKRYTFV